MAGAITSVLASESSGSQVADRTNQLGKDEFLKLLVTQLRYQDPMNPMNNEDFIAQLAQFSTLEAMTNMSGSFEGVQTYNLIGRRVVKIDPLNLEAVEGEVKGVKFQDGKYTLIVSTENSETVAKDDVVRAFSQSDITFEQIKDTLFAPDSLNNDILVWRPEIYSKETFAKALGVDDVANLPISLGDLWENQIIVDMPLDEVNYVYE